MQKFYCNNCGTKVDKNSSKCPNCGRFFRSVKCPACGFTANSDRFINGCPACGYAENFQRKNEKLKNNNSSFLFKIYKRILPVLILILIFLLFLFFRTAWQ